MTRIKITRDGREITYQDGTLYVAGKAHWYGSTLRPLTSAERAAVPAGILFAAGSVALTAEEATILQEAIREHRAANARIAAEPVNAERRRISAMYAQAERLEDYPAESITLRMRADAALKVWRATYPDAAREEDRQTLKAQAEHKRSLASGALTYDADGSLTPAMQEARHDEWMAEAAALDAQAAAL